MSTESRLETRLARVTGHVQGVGYRAWTCETARRLALSGWVRNEPDGSVSTLVQGPAEAVARLLARLGEGPSSAGVTGVVSEPRPPDAGLVGFRIVW